MELAAWERRLAPEMRMAEEVAAHLVREEIEAPDFDEFVRSKLESPQNGKLKRLRKKRARSEMGKRKVSAFEERESMFLSKEEKRIRAQRQSEVTREIYEQIAAGRRNIKHVDLTEHLQILSENSIWELGELFKDTVKLSIQAWRKISIAGLRSIALGFGDRLQDLDLSESPVTDEMVAMLTARVFTLKHLRFRKCKLLTNSAVRAIAEACFLTLRTLDLAHCGNISEDGLMWLGGSNGSSSMSCSKLVNLSVQGCTKVRDKGLIALGRGCRNLQYADFSGCSQLTDKGLCGLVATSSKLQVVNVSGCALIGDVGIEALGRASSASLRSINLSRCAKITDNGLEGFVNCAKLQAMNLAGCIKVSELGIFYLVKHNKAIQILNVNGCELISERGLSEMLRALEFVELAKSYTGFKPRENIDQLKVVAQSRMVADHASKIISAVIRAHGVRLRLKREKRKKKELAAAQTVQCWFRKLFAQKLFVNALLRKHRNQAAQKLQNWWKGRLGRLMCIIQRAKAKQRAYESVFAVKIQAKVRGLLARSKNPEVIDAISLIREIRQEEQEEIMVVRIQAFARGKISKSLQAAKKEELMQRSKDLNYAAICIQRIIRGKLSHLLLKRMIQRYKRRFVKEIRAATQIERIARGVIAKRIARDKVQERLEEHLKLVKAANMIQRVHRGGEGRRYFKLMKELRRRQILAATKFQSVFRQHSVPSWREMKLKRAKQNIHARAAEMHQNAAYKISKRIELREMGLARDSASEDEDIRALGGYIEEDESDDWQEHWDANLQRPFYFSPSRNVRTYEPYGDDSFDLALIGKYVRVNDQYTGQWRLGILSKYNKKKQKYRIEYQEEGDLDHEWLRSREEESRVQVYDGESESWGMLRHLRIAYQQLQKALRREIDELNASLTNSSPGDEFMSTSLSGSSAYDASNSDQQDYSGEPFEQSSSQDQEWNSSSPQWGTDVIYASENISASLSSDPPGTVSGGSSRLERYYDPETGLYYDYNPATGESTWCTDIPAEGEGGEH